MPTGVYERPSVEQRFFDKVTYTPTCWIWHAAQDGHGYGHFYYQGKVRKAYWAAYVMQVGPVPSGLELDHICRVQLCVNPLHLEPVTKQENMRRGYWPPMVSSRRDCCEQGHAYTPENLYVASTGHRYCRTCKRERWNLKPCRRCGGPKTPHCGRARQLCDNCPPKK